MKRSSIALLICSLCLGVADAFADPPLLLLVPGPVQATDMGDYHISGSWFALYPRGPTWHLSETRVNVVKDKGGDFEIKGTQPNAIALLQGKMLTDRQVEAAALASTATGEASNSFIFRGSHFRLVVHPARFKVHSPESGRTYDDVRNDVYFTDGTRRKLIYGGKESGQSCEHPTILWAGDIDGDGKPDLIADFSDDSQKNGSVCIFLSSGTKQGALLRRAGCQFFSG